MRKIFLFISFLLSVLLSPRKEILASCIWANSLDLEYEHFVLDIYTEDEYISKSGYTWHSHSTDKALFYTYQYPSYTSTKNTSSCRAVGKGRASKVDEFIVRNYPKLLENFSVGRGEYVSTLGKFFGCNSIVLTHFEEVSFKNYEKLAAAGQTVKIFKNNIQDMIFHDPVLSYQCKAQHQLISEELVPS